MTLRARLAIAFAAMAAVVAGLMGALGYAATANRIEQGMDDTLLAAAQRALSGPRPGDDDLRFRGEDRNDGRGDRPPRRPGPMTLADEGLAVTLVGADGSYEPIRGDNALEPQPGDAELAASRTPAHESRTQESDGVSYRVVAATNGNGRVAVLVGREWAEEAGVLRSLMVIMAALAVALSVIAAFAGWFLARRITGRLELLTATAEQVSDTGRLDWAVPGTGPDEVGRMAAAFNTMLGRLAQSQADQQRLVQDAGHELRTPLTSIRTNISLLERFGELSPEVRQRVLADLRGESRELSELINELLEVASGSTATASEPQPVILADVAERVVARAARKTDHPVEAECDGSEVLADPAALERAVWNLVDNAIKFDATASPIRIEVHSGRLHVMDRGPGIPEADRAHIFERFYRPVASRSLPGSGLGLSIVADVAAANDADATVAPRPGGGTVFTLTFRRWRDSADDEMPGTSHVDTIK